MGLDQYLYIERPGEDEDILVDTWRKSNQIQQFMDDLAIRRGLIPPDESLNASDPKLYLDEFDLITLASACEDALEALGFDPTDYANINDEALGINWAPSEFGEGLSFYEEGPNEWKPTLEQATTALSILPTQSGFFFGSTDVDVWYVQDLCHTLAILDNLAGSIEPGDKVYYAAWW